MAKLSAAAQAYLRQVELELAAATTPAQRRDFFTAAYEKIDVNFSTPESRRRVWHGVLQLELDSQ